MQDAPKTQFRTSSSPNHAILSSWTRRGNARMTGVALGIGALLAAGVAGYAIWTLAQAPTTTPIQLDPNDPDSGKIAQTDSIEEILGAVQVYVRNKQYAQATTIMEHAAGQYSSDQEIRFALGDLYMMQNMHAQAYDQYLAGIEIGPDSANAEFTAGTLANMLDRFELAEAHYSAAMRMDPTNPDTPIYLSAIQINLNRLDDAKVNLALAARLAPDRARVYAMRSEIAMRENKPGIALEQIRKARAIEPRMVAWIVQEAKVLKRDSKAQESVELLLALPQEQLEDPEIVYLIAECFGLLGRPGDAASRMMDLSNLNPQDAKIAFDTAVWLERAGDRNAAIEWAMKAQQRGSTQAGAWIQSLP